MFSFVDNYEDWLPVGCKFGEVCARKWEMSGDGKWAGPFIQFSFHGSWLSALWAIVRDMQGERFISQKIQEVDSNWETDSNLIHSHLFFFADLKKRKRKIHQRTPPP